MTAEKLTPGTGAQQSIDDFIKGAGQPITGAAAAKERLIFPWEGLDTRRKSPAFNLRMTDEKKEKLKYVSNALGVSQHEFCHDVIIEAMEKKLKELLPDS